MGNIIREAAGWLLLGLGLLVFRSCFYYLNQRQVIEAGVACTIGFFIFRAGMQLLKVSIAARAIRNESRV